MEERKKGKHLTLNDRLLIERLLNKKYRIKEIADIIGCSRGTIYYEIKRARYQHTLYDYTDEDRYCPELAEERYRKNLKKKGVKPKLLVCNELRSYIEDMIVNKHYSPEAIVNTIKNEGLQFEDTVSINTIYNAIYRGYIDNVSIEKLPLKRKPKKNKKHHIKVQKRVAVGTSIERRNPSILKRKDFGHWEMDTVVGQIRNRKCLLVLTERKTRMEIIEVLKSQTTDEVRKALNRIEKRFGSSFYKIFKSITVDNGNEFKDVISMEKALYRVGKRTKIFVCHPYSPHERGSNEVANKLIRRFLPKSSNFDKIINKEIIKEIQTWMNNYPRRIFKGLSSSEIYLKEITSLKLSFVI